MRVACAVEKANDILLMATRVLGRAPAFLELVGQTISVTIDGGDLSKKRKADNLCGGATPNAALEDLKTPALPLCVLCVSAVMKDN
jgi:hypothetical protein